MWTRSLHPLSATCDWVGVVHVRPPRTGLTEETWSLGFRHDGAADSAGAHRESVQPAGPRLDKNRSTLDCGRRPSRVPPRSRSSNPDAGRSRFSERPPGRPVGPRLGTVRYQCMRAQDLLPFTGASLLRRLLLRVLLLTAFRCRLGTPPLPVRRRRRHRRRGWRWLRSRRLRDARPGRFTGHHLCNPRSYFLVSEATRIVASKKTLQTEIVPPSPLSFARSSCGMSFVGREAGRPSASNLPASRAARTTAAGSLCKSACSRPL